MAREARVVLVATLIAVLTAMPLFSIGALGPQLQEKSGVTPGQIGAAVSAFTCGQAVSAFLLGRIADRVRASAMLKWSLVVAALSLLAIGAAQVNPVLLVVAAAIGGFGAAIAQPASSEYIVGSVSAANYGRTFGILQASKPITVLLLGLAVGVLAATRLNYLILPAVGALLCLVLVVFVPRSRAGVAVDERAPKTPLKRIPVLMLSLCAALSLGSGTTMVSFLPLSAVDDGLNTGAITMLVSIGSGIAIVMRVTVGIVADRRTGHPMVLAAVLLGLGAIGYALLAAASPGLEFVGGVLAFAGGWGSTGLLYLAGATSGLGSPARVTGIMVTGGGLGSTSIPLLFGVTAGAIGYSAAWVGLAVLAAVAALFAALVVSGHDEVKAGVPVNGS